MEPVGTPVEPGRYHANGVYHGTGEVVVKDGTVVGHSVRGNPKVAARVTLLDGTTEERTVMVHDLMLREMWEQIVVQREEAAKETKRRDAEALARDVEIVRRRGDETTFVVKSDYQYSLADITGPYDWTADQLAAVNEALGSLGHGYELPYDNRWQAHTGAELREALPELHGEVEIQQLINEEVVAPFLPEGWGRDANEDEQDE